MSEPASSEPEEQQSQPNGARQKKSRPTKQVDDSDTDPGYRSRSQSRRNRRQRQKQQQPKENPMPSLEENQQAEADSKAMQPFEHIGPDSTSMDGPVTYARAQRGEIPMREGNPNQQLKTGPDGGDKKESGMMDQDGLKLRLELNLDIEIELKATIKGDLTLALLA